MRKAAGLCSRASYLNENFDTNTKRFFIIKAFVNVFQKKIDCLLVHSAIWGSGEEGLHESFFASLFKVFIILKLKGAFFKVLREILIFCKNLMIW